MYNLGGKMKKNFLAIIMIMSMLSGFATLALAQDAVEGTAVEQTTETDVTVNDAASTTDDVVEFDESPSMSGFEMFARKILGSGFVDLFINGGFTMWPILILLIWAIATIIWKLVSLSYAKTNVNDFLDKIVPLIKEHKFAEAIKISESTKGPVAAVVHAGLLKADKGIESVEKAMENAGILEMAFLEKGFIPISTTINLAPMLGFFGTMVGMIAAFDAIAKAGEVDPTIVASGMKIALITTAAGLAVAIPAQFFNNMFLSMVDGLVMDIQKGSEKVIETLIENK
jgi:biopolymer transport protein ExbB